MPLYPWLDLRYEQVPVVSAAAKGEILLRGRNRALWATASTECLTLVSSFGKANLPEFSNPAFLVCFLLLFLDPGREFEVACDRSAVIFGVSPPMRAKRMFICLRAGPAAMTREEFVPAT